MVPVGNVCLFLIKAIMKLIHVSTKNLQEKYFNLKMNYIELDKIYGRLKEIESTNSVHEFSEIHMQYNNLLSSVDNHETIDYYRVLLSDSKEKAKLEEQRVNEINNYIKNIDRKENWYKITLYLMPLLLPIIIKFDYPTNSG